MYQLSQLTLPDLAATSSDVNEAAADSAVAAFVPLVLGLTPK